MIQNGTFCPEQMESSLSAVDAAAGEAGLDKQLRIKLRLLVEELLLVYRDALVEGSGFPFPAFLPDGLTDQILFVSAAPKLQKLNIDRSIRTAIYAGAAGITDAGPRPDPRPDVPAASSSEMKKANPLTAKGRTVRISHKKLKKKKKRRIGRTRAITVRNAQGEVTYKKISVSKKKYAKKFTVNKKTGRITVKRGVKRGTYRLKARVSAAGSADYSPGSQTVTVIIKVKQ